MFNELHYNVFQIATMLCGFHKLCQSGDEEKVREKLAQLPQASTQNSVQLASNSQEYDQVSFMSVF